MKRILFIIILISSCKSDKKLYYTSEFIEIDKIDSVKMNNYAGSFFLNKTQISRFKNDFSKHSLDTKTSYKLGAISFQIYIDSRVYCIMSNSKSSILEIPSDIISKKKELLKSKSLYFHSNGVNYQNYSPEK